MSAYSLPYMKVNFDIHRNFYHFFWAIYKNLRSNCPEVFFGKGVLKICSKSTGEHPCQSAISKQLY